MAKVSAGQAEAELKKGADKVTEDDIRKILEKQDEIERKFQGHGPIGKFIADVKIMFSLVRDYWDGTYREVPWMSIAAIVAALAYVFSPIDLLPDFIPFVGLVDDAAVVAACLAMVRSDLQTYVAWKKQQARA